MKKLFLIALMVLLTASFCYAEQSAQTYSGNANQRFDEQQVFVDAYNSSGGTISSNYVVVIDTAAANAASGTTLGTYITTTTTAADARVLGVTESDIPAGRVGRVCVRGPKKVYLTAAPSAAGATIATTTTAGAAIPWTAARPGSQAFGFALSATVIGGGGGPDGGTPPPVYDGFKRGEGTSNYWCYIGGAAR